MPHPNLEVESKILDIMSMVSVGIVTNDRIEARIRAMVSVAVAIAVAETKTDLAVSVGETKWESISSHDLKTLDRHVTEYLRAGWLLAGSMTATVFDSNIGYIQPVVRYGKEVPAK